MPLERILGIEYGVVLHGRRCVRQGEVEGLGHCPSLVGAFASV